MNTKRIVTNSIMLAALCVLGMISIPLGSNIKLSFQLLAILVIFGLSDYLVDKLFITGCYLLLGLVIPVYAGFQSSITPTFGYVIGFVLMSFPFHFIYKSKLKNEMVKYILASVVSLGVLYLSGTLFMMFYLKLNLWETLLISVVPYIGFDIAKIAIAYLAIKAIKRIYPKTKYSNL